jgi:hypothetical protein
MANPVSGVANFLFSQLFAKCMDRADIARDFGDDYLWQMGCHDPAFPRLINCFLCDASYATLQKRIENYGKALKNDFCNESLRNLQDGLAEDLLIISQRTSYLRHIESSYFDKSACLKHQRARMDNLDALLVNVNLVWHKSFNDNTCQAVYNFEVIPPIGTIPVE